MSALKKESVKNNINSTEFRRKLITIVRKYPSVWNNKKETDSFQRLEGWKAIEKEIGFPCDLRDIQAAWASLSEIYFRIIFVRTIERNFEAPVWVYFHDMSFLYDHVKETIQNQLGGISPPLFIPKKIGKKSEITECPCCAHSGPDLEEEPDMSSRNFKEEEEPSNIEAANSEASLQNNQDDTRMSFDFADSKCSFDSEYSEVQSSLFTNSPESQHIDAEDSLAEAPSQDLMIDKICETTRLRDNTESNNDSLKSQIPQENRKNVAGIESSEKICNSESERNANGQNNFKDILKSKSAGTSELASYSLDINDCLRDDCSLPEDESSSIEQVRSPGLSDITTDGDDKLIPNDKSKKSKNSNGEHTRYIPIDRSIIIEAIKAYPIIYLKTSTKKSPQMNNAWKSIGKELGNIPLHTLKNRWRLIKTRYLNELVSNTNSNGMLKSTWEFFDQMEFLRPHVQEDIEDLSQTRIQMTKAVRNKSKVYPCDANSTLELQETAAATPMVAEDTRNKISFVSDIREKENDTKNQQNISLNGKAQTSEVQNLTWEYFEQLNFLLPQVEEDINEVNRKLMQMKDKARKKRKEPTSVLQEPLADVRAKKACNISPTQEKEIDQAKSQNSQNNNVSYINTNQQIKIINVESMKQTRENYQEPKLLEQPVIFDENTLAILKNRPVKVTAVKIIPSLGLDLPNKDDKGKLNENINPEPPTKKLRKSTGPGKIEIHQSQTKIPVILPSPAAPCLTLDLTTDEATIEPAKTDKTTRLQPQKSQKVFPPLDLTLDDDIGVTMPKPSLQKIYTNFQKVFVDESVDTNNVFPTLDLTTDEKDENKAASKSVSVNETTNKTKHGKEKDDENVICLDDDDSAISYEEVLVYALEEDK